MLTNPPVPYDLLLKCERVSGCFRPGECPSWGLLGDCEIFADGSFTALINMVPVSHSRCTAACPYSQFRLLLWSRWLSNVPGPRPGTSETFCVNYLPPNLFYVMSTITTVVANVKVISEIDILFGYKIQCSRVMYRYYGWYYLFKLNSFVFWCTFENVLSALPHGNF